VIDNDFQDDVKHMALKYMTLVRTEPEMRIAYKILSSMLLLHQVSTIKVQHNDAPVVKVSNEQVENINAKFTDL